MVNMTEICEDLVELKELRKVAKRTCSQLLLDEHIKKVSENVNKMKQEEAKKERLAEGKDKEEPQKVYTVTLRTYSWDQSDKFMKLYVTIPGIVPSDGEKVKCTFSSTGVNLNISQLHNKNYQLVINNLAMSIVQEKSHWKTKDDMVIIFLCKERQSVSWAAVTEQEAKIKEKNKPDPSASAGGGAGSADPNDGIMGLMRKMYDDGDDSMKRMLNKTWYETQMKNGGAGGMGAMPGMGGAGGMGGMPDMGGMAGMPGMPDMGAMAGMPGMPDKGAMAGLGNMDDMSDLKI